MKLLATLSALLVLASAIPDTIHTRKQFTEFMMKYNVHYDTKEEYNQRYSNFLNTLDRINHKNERSKNARYGITEYADLSEAELLNKKSTPVPATVLARSCLASGVTAPHIPEDTLNAPDSFDWRTKNVVSPVKNQGQCGSCWTFSTTGNIESLLAIAGKGLVGLSEQEIVDCSTACSPVEGQNVCNSGCNGGWPWAAMADIMTWGGLETEAAYPYQGYDQTCQRNSSTGLRGALKNFTCVGNSEAQMVANLLATGPLSVALDATLVEDYTSGIIDPWFPNDDCDPDTLDHAVLIVGYGVEAGTFENTPYWIVKNSWGASWGENGYFRIYRGDGVCGINNAVSTAVLA